MKPTYIIIRHTADASREPQFDKVNRYHRRLWDFRSSLGKYAGYTYFIERNGDLIKVRADTEEGAHTKGMNSGTIGIGCAGNWNIEDPTQAQLATLKKLIREKMTEHKIPPYNIAGHRSFRQTSCPGNKISNKQIKALFQADTTYIEAMLSSILETLRKMLLSFGKRDYGCERKYD